VFAVGGGAPGATAVDGAAAGGERAGRHERDAADLLPHVVFEQLEVGGREVRDRVAALVAHHDVHHDGGRRGAEPLRRRLRPAAPPASGRRSRVPGRR
jgi:hypothetical protein